MIDLDRLQYAALWERGNALVRLTPCGTDATFCNGEARKRLQRFRTCENRQIAHRFLESMAERYGAHVCSEVLQSSGLGAVLAGNRPLRARHVRQAVTQANSLLPGVRAWNAALARSFVAPAAGDADNALLRTRIEREARRAFPDNPSVARLLCTDTVARSVEAAIVEAGRNGTRLVSLNDASDILARVVNRDVSAAFRNATGEAMRKLSLDTARSIGGAALAAAADGPEAPLNLEAARLTATARSELNGRMQAIVAGGTIAADRLFDEARLRALADSVMGEFVRERVEAVGALARVPGLGAGEREALAGHLLHDNVPARLVPALARAYVAGRDDVAALATPLRTAELQRTVAGLQRAMTDAFAEAGTEINDDNRDTLFRMYWRCLLIPGGVEQARAVAGRLRASGNSLRAIGEAANWYRNEYPGSDAAGQSVPPVPGTADGRADGPEIYPGDPSRRAARTAGMIGALIAVANERLDASEQVAPLEARGYVPDQTIATLRNFGVPMPGPDRVGEVHPNMPVSTPGLRAIGLELSAHMQSMDKRKLQDGVLQESIKDYDRNTYRLNGRQLPRDKRAVVRELRNFCTDDENRLNENLLKTVSAVAYQATPGCVMATCLNPLRAELAVFDGLPTMDPVATSYNISSGEGGDVIVNCQLSGPVIRYSRFDRFGQASHVEMDPSDSLIRIDMTVRIDTETAQPELQGVNITYCLVPLQPPGAEVE